MRGLSYELLAQLDTLPREGAHILHPDGETATWCYDPSFFVAMAQRLGVTGEELCRRLGWSKSYGTRALGMRPYYSGNGNKSIVQTIGYDKALKLTEALRLDPTDTGV